MTTVACVWVRAHVPYRLEYVTNLRAMVARHLYRAHRFVCLTDQPELLPRGIRGIRIPNPKPLLGWWSKVQLFNPAHALGDRVLYLDLDTLVVGALDPIVDYPSSFALAPHAGSFEGRDGLRVVKRFNSSVMTWDAPHPGGLYENWTPAVAARLHGDQDWIGEQCPAASSMPLSWFPRLSELNGHPPNVDARVVLMKTPKNHVAAEMYPWVHRMWRAA